jgi:hypothetical protein
MREGRREKAGGGLSRNKEIKILEKMKLLNLIKKQTVNQTMNAFYVQVPPSDCPHHLIHRTDTDMEIPTCILLLLMFMTSLLKSAPILTVREIEGSLTVKEKVDLTRMQKHAHLWAQELLTEKDKLNSLTAAQKIRELSLLTLTLQSQLHNYRNPCPHRRHPKKKRDLGKHSPGGQKLRQLPEEKQEEHPGRHRPRHNWPGD